MSCLFHATKKAQVHTCFGLVRIKTHGSVSVCRDLFRFFGSVSVFAFAPNSFGAFFAVARLDIAMTGVHRGIVTDSHRAGCSGLQLGVARKVSLAQIGVVNGNFVIRDLEPTPNCCALNYTVQRRICPRKDLQDRRCTPAVSTAHRHACSKESAPTRDVMFRSKQRPSRDPGARQWHFRCDRCVYIALWLTLGIASILVCASQC